MQIIDLDSWPRRPQYDLYRACAQPLYELTFRQDVGDLLGRCKAAGQSPFGVILAGITTAVNQLPAFRQRQRGETVVQHDVVHPSWVVLGQDRTLGFARGRYHADLAQQLAEISRTTARARAAPDLSDAHAHDDQLFASSVAPLDLVSANPERSGRRDESVPRFLWGRVVDGKLNLTVSVNHCFVDGMHVAELSKVLHEALSRELPARG